MRKNAIVAGGLDPSGGAGLASDIKVCAFFNTYPLPVITALTYQNSTGFFGFEPIKKEKIEKQLKSILGFYPLEFAKIGLTGNSEVLETLINLLHKHKTKIVYDPVLKTSTEGIVSDNNLIDTILENSDKFFLITPNIPEAQKITELNSENQKELGEELLQKGFENVLIKGGHLEEPYDMFLTKNEFIIFKGEKLETENTRGTGCALSSAIVSNLALGKSLKQSIAIAKNYITEAMNHSYKIAKPPYPLNLLLK